MGVVRKQSIQSSILFYIGAGIGFLNRIFIFTNLLTTAEVGLANILLTTSMMYAQFSALGYTNVTLKFFPYFRNKEKSHHGFFFWSLLVPLLGFLFVTLHFVLWKPYIMPRFADKSPLFVEYYYYIIPLGFFTLYFNVFETYLRSLYKTVVPVLLKEVVQRILITVSILVYALGWVDFSQFVLVYVILISSVTLIMVLYIMFLKQWSIGPRGSWRMRQLGRRMFNFGLYSFLSNVSLIIIFNIDSLMLADFKGMSEVGIYTTAFYITALLQIPWKALQRIALPIVAELWKERDMVKLGQFYKRTSLLNFLVGCFLFLGLLFNMDSLFSMMTPEYKAGAMVIFYIGLARLIEMLTGLNAFILVTSEKFRLDLWLTLLMVVLTVWTNYIFIPMYGVTGAAIATALTYIFINIVRLVIIWYYYKLQPFSLKMLIVIGVSVISYLIQYSIPKFSFPIFDIFIRSLAFTSVFVFLALILKISPDINNLFKLVRSKINL